MCYIIVQLVGFVIIFYVAWCVKVCLDGSESESRHWDMNKFSLKIGIMKDAVCSCRHNVLEYIRLLPPLRENNL